MGIRIILVSAVAVMGLSLPSVDQVGEWRTVARGWVNERLAEWDAQMPVDQNAFVIVAEPTRSAATAPLIEPGETTETLPVVSAAPVAVTLDERSAGLEAPTRPMDLDEAEPAPASVVATSPTPSVLVLDPGFAAAQDEFVAGYLVEVATAERRREAIALAQLAADLDFEWNLVAEQAEARLSIVEPTVSQSDLTETIEVVESVESLDESLDAGIAYELSQYAEGLESLRLATAQQAEQESSTFRDGRLTTAVRLTREAVHAWASVLHGPAIVSLGQ